MHHEPTQLFAGHESSWERLDPEFGHWLAGFVDGEGCFAITANGRTGQLRCLFRLSLRNDDGPILREIRERVAVGTFIGDRIIKDGHPQATWTVTSKRDCLVLVHLFRRFPLRAKKARDFEIWAPAVEAWQTATYVGGRRHQQNWTPLIRARAELTAVRAYPENSTIPTEGGPHGHDV